MLIPKTIVFNNEQEEFMEYFTNLIFEYGLIAMFVIIMLEYACFPVSSEIVLPFSGAVASVSHIPFLLILPVSIVAGLIGTSICYIIGRYGGTPFIQRIIHRFPKTEKSINASYANFEKYGTYAVCILRLIPLCRTYIAFIAGALGQNYLVFIVSSFIGITVWNTILIGIGYFLKENWKNVIVYYDEYKTFLIPILVILLILLAARRVLKKEKASHI